MKVRNAAYARPETKSHTVAQARCAIGRGVSGTTHGRPRPRRAGRAPRARGCARLWQRYTNRRSEARTRPGARRRGLSLLRLRRRHRLASRVSLTILTFTVAYAAAVPRSRRSRPLSYLAVDPEGGGTTLIPPYARRYIGGVERGAGGIIAPANRESCRAGCCCDRCICEKTTCCDCGISAGADVVLVIVGVKRGCGRSGMWPRLRSCSCARLIVPVCCALSIERSAALVGAAVFGRSWAC